MIANRLRQGIRSLHSTSRASDKVLLVLYDDPETGYPKKKTDYARDDLPVLPPTYPDGQKLPTPQAIDFTPGELLGSVSGELGLRKFLESRGHELVVTSDKDGPQSVAEKEIADASIVISQPFFPLYATRERIAKSPNLDLLITAGIGSDHVDLEAACERNITVAEVTYCNSNSVAEHVVMSILSMVRNFIPSHEIIKRGGWNIADAVMRSYDVEGMSIGTVASGRIGLRVLRLMHPFGCKLLYTDRHRLPESVEKELNLQYFSSAEEMAPHCDVLTLNCPLHPETEHMVNDRFLSLMKRGSYIVNTARGKLCDTHAIVRALESGHLAGYSGDVFYPQPAPVSHPWRTMPNQMMTPHISGTSLSAQARYAAGVREILECYFDGKPIRDEYLIAKDGKLAGVGAHSYSPGNSTGGSEEAEKFKMGQ